MAALWVFEISDSSKVVVKETPTAGEGRAPLVFQIRDLLLLRMITGPLKGN